MASITIKRGATLDLTVTLTNPDGTPTALSGLTLTAMVRDAQDVLVATLTPTPAAAAGQAVIYVQDTSAWPEGLLAMDVMVQAAGGPQTISDTFGIQVERAETYTLPPLAPYDPVNQP